MTSPISPAKNKEAHSSVRPGQGLVEFALVTLFVLVPVIFGTIELGRGVWYYNQLSQLSREGARWLVVVDQHGGVPGRQANGNIYNWQPSTTYSPSACTSCPNTTVSHIRNKATGIQNALTIIISRQNPAPPGPLYHGMWVEVEVQYPYQPIISTVIGIPGTITMSAKTRMDME